MNPNDTNNADNQSVTPQAAAPVAPTTGTTVPAQTQPMPSIEPSVPAPATEAKAEVNPDVPGSVVSTDATSTTPVAAEPVTEPVSTTQAPDPSQAVVNEPTESVTGGSNE
jgi:hypothetical protein